MAYPLLLTALVVVGVAIGLEVMNELMNRFRNFITSFHNLALLPFGVASALSPRRMAPSALLGVQLVDGALWGDTLGVYPRRCVLG